MAAKRKKKASRARGSRGRRTKRSGGSGISVKDTGACFKRLTDCGTSPSIANYYCKDGNQKFKNIVKVARAQVVTANAAAVSAAKQGAVVAKQQVKTANASYLKFKKARAQVLSSCKK